MLLFRFSSRVFSFSNKKLFSLRILLFQSLMKMMMPTIWWTRVPHINGYFFSLNNPWKDIWTHQLVINFRFKGFFLEIFRCIKKKTFRKKNYSSFRMISQKIKLWKHITLNCYIIIHFNCIPLKKMCVITTKRVENDDEWQARKRFIFNVANI